MAFRAYMLRCSDGTYHVGQTDQLKLRIGQHRNGSIESYTQKRRPEALVWGQDFPSRLEALEAERRIKGWSRAKEALIVGDRQRVSQRARNRQDRVCPSASSGLTDGGANA